MPSLEGGTVVGVKAGEGRIEHFPARHHDDIEAGCKFVAPEELAGEPFGSIPFHRRADLAGGSHAEPGRRSTVRHHEQHHESAVDADACVVGALELGPAPDPLRSRQSLPARHG
jgi:hypothetical protein